MVKEMENSKQINDAFQAIKTATQVSDVQEMVRKFLTKEQTYGSLLKTVNASDSKIEVLRRENEELRARLHDLNLDVSNQGSVGGNSADNDQEIIVLKNQLREHNKEGQKLAERFKSINIVNDQISNWSRKCWAKFANMTDDEAFKKAQPNLIAMFEGMAKVVKAQLNEIAETHQEDEGQIDYDKVF